MALQIETSISMLTVFLQGILRFFSTCILPLLPVYLGYLAGNREEKTEIDHNRLRKKTFINSLFFVLGVSGLIMILFGLYQFGIFGKLLPFEKERRLHLSLDRWVMGPGVAFLFGFTFSFAWTPCVGDLVSAMQRGIAGYSKII